MAIQRIALLSQTMLDKADSDLFCNMRRSYHCLHHVLPPPRTVDKSPWSPLQLA